MDQSSDASSWLRPGWRADAETWISHALARIGRAVIGPIEQIHLRPWSAVLRVPTADGSVYFKAVEPRSRHEVVLTAALAEWCPAAVLPVLAADAERGWMLVPDGGTPLRPVIRADHDLAHWERALPIYAELQAALASRVPWLLEQGVPDRRLSLLPAAYRALIADDEVLQVDQPNGLSAVELGQLHERAAHVGELCERLASFDLPESLNHGDLHDANVFLRDGSYVFFDWGDASVTHPFFSLRTAYVSAEISLGLDEGAPELDRLRDAYLEPWTRIAPRALLVEAFAVSQRLATLVSALGWHRALAGLEPAQRAEQGAPVVALLQEFLAANAG